MRGSVANARFGTTPSQICKQYAKVRRALAFAAQLTNQRAFVSLSFVVLFCNAFFLADNLFAPLNTTEHEILVEALLLWSAFNNNNVHILNADDDARHLKLLRVLEHFEAFLRICKRENSEISLYE